jgi:hypothetical protein
MFFLTLLTFTASPSAVWLEEGIDDVTERACESESTERSLSSLMLVAMVAGESRYSSVLVRLRLVLVVAGAGSSRSRFLGRLCRVPGCLSGPLRFGTASYSQRFDLRAQLLHVGRLESQRIFRLRL